MDQLESGLMHVIINLPGRLSLCLSTSQRIMSGLEVAAAVIEITDFALRSIKSLYDSFQGLQDACEQLPQIWNEVFICNRICLAWNSYLEPMKTR